MRLWSLHPRYLDPKGLVALWREGLLAQAVLAGRTRGYRNHPQLIRFREAPDPAGAVAAYLVVVQEEAVRRGYRFDAGRLGPASGETRLAVTEGQLEYEWRHLEAKFALRAPEWLRGLGPVDSPEPHPMFRRMPGPVAAWEAAKAPCRSD